MALNDIHKINNIYLLIYKGVTQIKMYNNFNEMFNDNSNNNIHTSVFNYGGDFRSLQDDVAIGVSNAVDEWADKLTKEEQIAFASDGYNWITDEDKWDDLYNTSSYKKMENNILSGNLDYIVEELQEENWVQEQAQEHYGIDVTSTEVLQDFYRDYKRGLVADVIEWLSTDENFWGYYIDLKQEEIADNLDE